MKRQDSQAIKWVKQSYGNRWKRYMREQWTPEKNEREKHRHWMWHPFGIPEWNLWTQQAQRELAAVEGFEPMPSCEWCKGECTGGEPFTLGVAIRILTGAPASGVAP